MNVSTNIRVIHDPPLDGPTNMARDEALMTRVGAGESPPTLRLYQWNPPTISLGYFQPYADYEALDPPAGKLAVVRRLTGGGAILHDLELTYSLALPAAHSLLKRGPRRLYELAHDAIAQTLRLLDVEARRCEHTDDSTPTRGPFFCFERRHCLDLLIDDAKVAGSAQRRTQTAILQHGSIVLGNRFTQQPTAALQVPFETCVNQVRSSFVTEFARVAAQSVEPGEWSPEELEAAGQLVEKYATSDWTRRA